MFLQKKGSVMRAPRVRPRATNEAPVAGGPNNKARNLVGFLISQKSSRSTGELSLMNATSGAEINGVVATCKKEDADKISL